MNYTPEQIVEILDTGNRYWGDDEIIHREKKRIHEKYEELKCKPIWFEGRGPQGEYNGPGAMLIPGFEYASIQARVWWLKDIGLL